MSAETFRLVLPERAEDALSEGLRALTKHLAQSGRDTGYGLGGEYGYGVEFENDVFMMHPYCWCVRDECPWCGGCQVRRPDPVHADDCYQHLVRAELVAAGFVAPYTEYPTYVTGPDSWSYDKKRAVEERVRRKWCAHFGLPYPDGCAVHCTCGAHAAWQAVNDACTCDHCIAGGVWAEKGAEPKRGAPNFWHKPSGLKVWWYKWIGRSMEIHGEADPATIIFECIVSV